jgi:hypothetical protein
MGFTSNISDTWNKVKKYSKTMKQKSGVIASQTSAAMKKASDEFKKKVGAAGKKAAAKTKSEQFAMIGGRKGRMRRTKKSKQRKRKKSHRRKSIRRKSIRRKSHRRKSIRGRSTRKKRGGDRTQRKPLSPVDAQNVVQENRLPLLDRITINGKIYSDQELMDRYCKNRPSHSQKLGGPRKCRTGDVIEELQVGDTKITTMPYFKCVRENDPLIKEERELNNSLENCQTRGSDSTCKKNAEKLVDNKRKQKAAEESTSSTWSPFVSKCVGKITTKPDTPESEKSYTLI